ncbi:MAG: DUF485 domain-containing protein [Thiohalocapsa sp.]|jgi:uncharacterized membrane protein (DUF485 family)|nr:DUF485 domain-containing protein [Thiohalocapsa sp.]MCF7989996.1 DUF485 domain-containing protein [Thiohalocapsa sp.]
MEQSSVDAIKAHPRYRELVQSRRRFALTLTGIVLVIYYGFILTIAFAPSLLGTPVAAGAVTTIGIPIGILIIVSAFLLTGIYVIRANGRFDALTKALQEDLQ